MNRDVCEHFNPVDLPCEKCKSASVQKSTLREAAQQALEAWDQPHGINYVDFRPYMDALRAALAESTVPSDCADSHQPVAWYHVPHPGNGISPMVSLSQQHEQSIYGAVVPLYLKEQL